MSPKGALLTRRPQGLRGILDCRSVTLWVHAEMVLCDANNGDDDPGDTMADKSPKKSNTKKPGKSLKEKRNVKHAKKESKKGFIA